MRLLTPKEFISLAEIIEERVERVKEIEVVKLNDTPNITQMLVFIRSSELPHYHREHDLTFILLKGHGELFLSGRRLRMQEGDVAFIPRGEVHYYTNTSTVSVLLANFCPHYDGKDSVRVSAESL
jgi:quercetin dioxygenase-like cupin family protein